MTADGQATMTNVAVGVIDVGSNSVRLLVAVAGGGGVEPVHEDRAYPRLGAEIEAYGGVRTVKLDGLSAIVARFAREAHEAGAQHVEALVTAPGRQASNAVDLLDAVAHAARIPVRVVSAEEEATLAFRGALLASRRVREPLAVCDVGGGSTEVAVGAARGGPTWVRSVDIGALRLTTACLPSDPPGEHEVEQARAQAAAACAALAPPPVQSALAVGGSARALARVVGPPLGERELAEALRLVTERKAAKVARAFGLDEQRARVLPAGALILAEVSRRLGAPLTVARGGLREGAVAAMLAERLAA